jgi:hypothetical protein
VIRIDDGLRAADLRPALARMWTLSAAKIRALDAAWDAASGSPVFTVEGRYTARGWTEWTQGFVYGSALLQFEATGERAFLESGRKETIERMAPHLSHVGVHDHGFNNVSTYGALLRMVQEGRVEAEPSERALYETAIKVSGAIQARRWTDAADGHGFIHSFNGAHSLFADTMRTLRALALAHRLGHVLFEEGDRRVSLLERLVLHARATATYAVFYGEGRDIYDVAGRVAHESLFNVRDGRFRCPGTQQGYSGFTTWTRGLAWVLLGFAEEMEWIAAGPADELGEFGGRDAVLAFMRRAACATADFYLGSTPPDGIPYWDTGAPGLAAIDLEKPGNPENDHEPVDSSAAAIAAQGLIRLGRVLAAEGKDAALARRYQQAGLTVTRTLLASPYLSEAPAHQGLLLHSVYHRPNGWDFVPKGRRVPCGESSQWGDYHLRELGLYVQRIADGGPDYRFFAA